MKKWTALLLCILAVFVLFTAAQADPEPEQEPYIRIAPRFGEEGETPFLPLWESDCFEIETNAAHNEEVLFFYDEGADPIPAWVNEDGYGEAWFTPGTTDCNIFEYTESYNAGNPVHTYTAHVETMAEDPADAVMSNEVEYRTGLVSAEPPVFAPEVEVTYASEIALRKDDVFSATVSQEAGFQNMCIVLFDENGDFAADSHWVGVDPEAGPEADQLTIEVPLLRLEINKHYTAKIYGLMKGRPMAYVKNENGQDLEYDVLILSPSSQAEDTEIMIRGLNEEYPTGEMILPTVYYPNSEKLENIQMELQIYATRYEENRREWDRNMYVWPEEDEWDIYYQPEVWDDPISSWSDGEHVFRVIVWQREGEDEFIKVDETERTFTVTSAGPLVSYDPGLPDVIYIYEGQLPDTNDPNLPDVICIQEEQLPYTIEIERPDAEGFVIGTEIRDLQDGHFIDSRWFSEWNGEEVFEIPVEQAGEFIEIYIEIRKHGYDLFWWSKKIPVIRAGERIQLETEAGLDSEPLLIHTDIPLWVSAPGADWIRVDNVYGEFFRTDNQEQINDEFPIEFNDSIREVGSNPIIATAQFTVDEDNVTTESAVLIFEGYADGDAGPFTAEIDRNSAERGEPVTVTYTESENADHYWTDVDIWNEERQDWDWITHQADLNGPDGGTAILSTIELEPGATYRFRALAEGIGYRTAEYIITESFTVREPEIPESGILVTLNKDEVETCEDVVVSAYAPGAEWMEVYWDYGNDNRSMNHENRESRSWNHSYGHAGSREIRVKAGRTERDENGDEIWDHDDEGHEWPVQTVWWSDPVTVTITAPYGPLELTAPALPDSFDPSEEEKPISFTVNKPVLADYLNVSAWFDGEERDLYRGETAGKKLDVNFSTALREGQTLRIGIHAEKQGYNSADLTLNIPVIDSETVSDLVELSVDEGEITFDPDDPTQATVPVHGNIRFLVGAAEGHTLAAVKFYGPGGWWGDEDEEITPENHGDWFRNDGKAFFWTDFGDEDNIGRKVPVFALALIDVEEEWVWVKSQVLWVHVLDHQIGSYSFTGETSVTAARGEDVEFTFTPARGADDYWVDAWDINNMWDSFQPESFWDGTKVTMSTASLPEGEYIIRGRAGADGKGWRESDNSARLTVTASNVQPGEVKLTVNKTKALTEERIYASVYAPGADWVEIIRRNEDGQEDDFANDGGEGTSGCFSEGNPQTVQVFARAHYFERDDEGELISEGINEWGDPIWKEEKHTNSRIEEIIITAPNGRIEQNASGIPAYVIAGQDLDLYIPYPEEAEYMDWELFLNRDFDNDEQEPDERDHGEVNLTIPGNRLGVGYTIELRVSVGGTGYEHNHQDYQIRVIAAKEERIKLTVSKSKAQVNEDLTVTISVDEGLEPEFVQYYNGDRFWSYWDDENGRDEDCLKLDKNNQWIFDGENFDNPGVRMLYARAWFPGETEEDEGYWIESDPVKLTLTRTGVVGEFTVSLQKATVARGETAVLNYTVGANSDEDRYDLHHDREREGEEEQVDYHLPWQQNKEGQQFTFSTAGMPEGEYRLSVWACGKQGYEGRESSSIWLTVTDSGIPAGEVRLTVNKTEAQTEEDIYASVLAPGADWIEIIRRYEDGRENAFADNGGDSTSGTLNENHAETLEVFARAHYFKRDENGDPISTGTNDQGDDIWEELPYVNSEIVEVTFTAPYGRIEQNASGIPVSATAGRDLTLAMPRPVEAEYMDWQLYLNRDFDDDWQEPDYSGSGVLNKTIFGDEIVAGNIIELRVWVGGRGYEHNHQNYRIRVIAGHENNISLAVDKPTVQVNEKLKVTITVNRELEEGERVRYYNGNNFWSYGWDNYDLELDENRRWINNDESFGGAGVMMLYACIIPEGEDENEAAWTISDPVKVTVTRIGRLEPFDVSLEQAVVTRGETAVVNYPEMENSYEPWFELRHSLNLQEGEEEFDYGLNWQVDETGNRIVFSTADMPAGEYRLSVNAAGGLGYEGRESRPVLLTVEDPAEPTVIFEVSKSTVMTNEDLQAGVYAPGADRTEIFWHDDDIWRQDGDSWTGSYRYGNSGTYQVFARAWYPEVDDQGNPSYADSDRITITVTSNGQIIPLDFSGVPARFFDRTSATIVVDKPDESDYMGWEIWIDGEKFADHNSSESESINKNIPGGKLHEDGTVQLKVWTGAVGYDNNYQELRIPVVRKGDVRIPFAATNTAVTCADITCTAVFPAGKYSQIQLFNGERERYEPEEGEDIGATDTEWEGSTSFEINGTYTLYARLWSVADEVWVYTDEAKVTVTAPNGPLTLDTSDIPAQLFAGSGDVTFSFGQIKDRNGATVAGAQVNYQLYYEEDNRIDLITWEEAKDETVTISSDEIVDGRVFRLDYNVFQEGYEPVLGGVDIPVVAAPTVTLSVDRKTVTYGEGVTFTVNAPGAESVQVRRWENDQPGGEIVLEGSTWIANEIGTIRFCATATYDGFDDLFISAQPVSVTVRTIGPAPAPAVTVPETAPETADGTKSFTVTVTPAEGGWAAVSIYASGPDPVYEEDGITDAWTYTVKGARAGEYQVYIAYGQDGYDNGPLIEKDVRVAYVYGEPAWTWADDFSEAKATFTSLWGDDVQEIPAQVTSEVTTEPTCNAEGVKTYTATATFQDQDYTNTNPRTETLEKTAHKWGMPVFEWSKNEGEYSATATFTCCETSPAHTRTEDAEVTLLRQTGATCTESEIMVYRAVCEGYRQDTAFTGADPLGHDWAWRIVWNDDYTAYAERECGRCGETETAEATVTFEVTKAATCSARGEMTYTAIATPDGPEGQEVTSSKKQFTPKTAHIPGEPAFSDDFLFIYTHCSVCGSVLKAEEHGADHSWSQPVYEWAEDYSTVTATHVCSAAAALTHEEKETAATEAEVIESPTAKAKGKVRYTTAEFTNPAFTAQTKTVDIPTLTQMNTLKLPSGLKAVEAEAFSNLACQAVIIPDGCTAIGENAFRGCVNLKYVRIPASVPKDSWLENNAFEGCSPDLVIDYAGD